MPDDPHTRARAHAGRTHWHSTELTNTELWGHASVVDTSGLFPSHTHTHLPFEAREPTGLKTDIALQQLASHDDPSVHL